MKKRTRSSRPKSFAISHCFISSREKTTSRRGLYLARVIGTNALPKSPVPPVSRIEAFLSIGPTSRRSLLRAVVPALQRDYAYHFIDRAVPPEIKDSPKRTLLTIGGAFLGMVAGLSFIALSARSTARERLRT